MATTEVGELAAAARAALADGRVHDALTCYASATRSARTQLPPHAPERIALAAEHAQAVFDHRSDPGRRWRSRRRPTTRPWKASTTRASTRRRSASSRCCATR